MSSPTSPETSQNKNRFYSLFLPGSTYKTGPKVNEEMVNGPLGIFHRLCSLETLTFSTDPASGAMKVEVQGVSIVEWATGMTSNDHFGIRFAGSKVLPLECHKQESKYKVSIL